MGHKVYSTDTREDGVSLSDKPTLYTSAVNTGGLLAYKVNHGFKPGDYVVVGWQIANTNEWAKVYDLTPLKRGKYYYYNDIRVTVIPPGRHPGGNCYWLEPSQSIYVPLYAEIDDDGDINIEEILSTYKGISPYDLLIYPPLKSRVKADNAPIA